MVPNILGTTGLKKYFKTHFLRNRKIRRISATRTNRLMLTYCENRMTHSSLCGENPVFNSDTGSALKGKPFRAQQEKPKTCLILKMKICRRCFSVHTKRRRNEITTDHC
jgi:hypothetical protein